MTRAAIRKGADINHKYENGYTALHHAVWFTWYEHTRIPELLIDKGAEINAKTLDGRTPLYTATRRLNLDAVKLLLAAGGDPNLLAVTGFKASLIHNTLDCVVISEPLGCGVAGSGQPKEELLAKAKEIIRLLLDHGADPNVKSQKFGWTPLIEVASNLTTEDDLVRLLIEHGADPNLTDEKGKTALDYAYERKDDVLLIDGNNIYGPQVYNYLNSIRAQ